MAVFALHDVDLFAGGARLACVTNQVMVKAEADELDATTFCAGGWTVPIAGRKSAELSASGPQDFAAAAVGDPMLLDEWQAANGGIGSVMNLAAVPIGGTEGNVAYFCDGVFLGYAPLDGAVSDLGVWDGNWKGRGALVRGVLASQATVTASGNGTGHNLGAVSASQRVSASFHALTAGGTTPSITVRLESDDNGGFTTPTTRATFAAQTTRGGQFTAVLGPITDTFWRLAWTVSGTTPSFQLRGLIGIQ